MFGTRRWDGEPETPTDSRFFDLRESGYTGWVNQHGDAVSCPCCGSRRCTASLTESCNG